MIGIYLAIAVTLLIAGAVAGAAVVVSLGIHREERQLSLLDPAPDKVARGVRRLNGVYTRIPDPSRGPAASKENSLR